MARRFAGRLAVIMTIIATYMGWSTRCFAGSGGKLQSRYLPRAVAALTADAVVSCRAVSSPEQQERALAQVEKALQEREGGSRKVAFQGSSFDDGGILGNWVLDHRDLEIVALLEKQMSFALAFGLPDSPWKSLAEKLEFVNTWNSETVFTKAYTDEDGYVMLRYELDLTAIDIEAHSVVVTEAVGVFEDSIDIFLTK
eukprot:3039041-Amphidinium_carterae.1